VYCTTSHGTEARSWSWSWTCHSGLYLGLGLVSFVRSCCSDLGLGLKNLVLFTSLRQQLTKTAKDRCCGCVVTSTTPVNAVSQLNPLMGTLKSQSNGPLYINRPTVIGTLAVNGWAVTFSTARRGLGGLRPRPVPSSLYQM